ncbi:DEAD/DEAH box helicase [Chitinophaga horti]|uniref:DEAD/DEAH box helicase n=1 Tax=Chitinophaga horti TaxID=2920382 RepID=A0ABY6J050_9BACT|nr:DEAD/DEAH box helicase [Chitinophaga horti]UYQ91751.1 DEAD/DEAH box helicase [Chitinophaga horti]
MQYMLLDGDARLVTDILSLYLYPLEKYRVTDAVNRFKKMEPTKVAGILEQLQRAQLAAPNTAGNFALVPELAFLLFPQNIQREEYQRLLHDDRGKRPSFYNTSFKLAELQETLMAYCLGDLSLMSLPVRKIELDLEDFLPWLPYLLYYPAYKQLLQLFSEDSFRRIQSRAIWTNLLEMAPLADLEVFDRDTNGTSCEPALLQGRFPETGSDFEMAVTHLYRKQPEQAFAAFERGIKLQRKTDKKNMLPASPAMAFYYAYTISLLPLAQTNMLVAKLIAFYEKKLAPANIPAICLLHYHSGKRERAEDLLRILIEAHALPGGKDLPTLLALLCLRGFHANSKLLVHHAHLSEKLLTKALENGYLLPAYEYQFLLEDDRSQDIYEVLKSRISEPPAFAQMQKIPEWERLLDLLLAPERPNAKKDKATGTNRLVYLVDFDRLKVQPMLQTMQASGWSAGRMVALKKLKEGAVPAMLPHDQRIAQTILKETHFNYYGGEQYVFDDNIWTELAGHPYLFLMHEPTMPAEIEKGEVELAISTTNRGYIFSANITEANGDFVVLKESETKMKIIRLNQQQRFVLNTLKQLGTVPAEGKEKLLEAIKKMGSHITIHSDLDESAISIRRLNSDSRIRIQLQPVGDALKASFFVKPLGDSPPYCRPGTGARNIIGIVNGERCQASRDVEQEKANMQLLMQQIQQHLVQEVQEDDVIVFEDPADCLQLLEIIQSLPDITVVEWPEGTRFQLRGKAGLSDLRLMVKEKGHWFAMQGELQIDERTVINLKQVLDILPKRSSRFIELDNGHFLALSADLRARLNEVLNIGVAEAQEIKIPYFAAHLLDELLSQAGSVRTDTPWKQFKKKKSDAALVKPAVPAGLRQVLRPYQEDGFHWMAQLAAWGAGACLADDMGLGKTIQAISILLHRAADGAALVISPASVLPNWANELARFAPELNVIQLQPGSREKQLQQAAAFDIVITTYGILQSEAEAFENITWNTIVLDEAHTIKNYQTRTSRAAMKLTGNFRLALTGTPIQNHLGEIWNLFTFLNPGLLGDLPSFRKQFVTPSANNPESMAKKHLKKLIAPFMLRRLKSDVLEELPPKTEIVKLVTLSVAEAAFYEAIRRQALQHMQERDLLSAGQQHIKALQEITRLRMAACNPQLIEAETDIESSKMAALKEIVEELTANNHRALVFSQFVKHLSLVAKALHSWGIPFLYLDGSTPIPAREKLVKSFQAGEAPLFLISLKAGGLGLNLTAADYVIHLDPWWNPAVEEQASDRAHRMGQTRPVTIYRLVAQHTIEEKIIELHHNKRDLADQLLEGTDQSVHLSVQDLVALISTS